MTFTIDSVSELRLGDIGFASIRGSVGAGVLAGQTGIDLAALLRGRPATTAGWITHAFMVTQTPGDGTAALVEAMPGGAREVWIEDAGNGVNAERHGPGFAYVRLPDRRVSLAAAAARDLVGTPYGFAQYAAIAGLTLLGGDTANPKGILAQYVRKSPAMICSQLVDEAYRRAGIRLFDDGRPPAYVTPGALFWRTAQIGDVCVF
jgi:hypothetical protein